jgi:hypothetical protein
MIIDLKVLDEVKFKFLELGVSVTEMASKNDAYFKNIYFSMERLNTMMKSVIDDDQLEVVAKHADAIVNQFKKVDDIFADMAKSYKGADVLGDSLNNLNSKFDKMSTDLTAMKAEKTASDKKKLEEKKNEGKDKKSKPGYLDKEMQGVMGKLNSLMSKMMVPSAGALLAGGIGILAYGVSEQQRMKAEAGEASDIIVVAADGHLKKLKNRATAFLSGFQESLQKFYGVSRQEVQAAAKVFSEGGTQIADWMNGRDASLGLAGRNFLSFSLGVDKLLNVAGGTTARAMVDYAERYGMSLEESKNTLTRMLEIGGEEGGLGFVRFSKMVNEAAPALERLGFSVDATTEFMGKMQGAFEGLKIPKQMAGNLLVKGTQKMAEGLSSMSEGWVRAFAERMGMGEGPEAVQKFREYWVRMMKTKGNPEEFDKFINLIVEESLKLFEGNELKTRYFMSNVLGMGTEGAFLATESYKAGKNPDLNPKKKYDAAKKARESLKDAYKTEREKRTEWELGMNEWMKAISKIGIAALSLLARALGKMVLYFRSIPAIVSNLMNDNKKQGREDNEKLFNRIEELMSDDGKSFKLLRQGFEELGIAGKKLLGASFGENLDAISNAFSEDPFSLSDSDRESSRENATGGYVGSSYTPPSSVRVVTVPIERLGSVDVHSPKEDLRSKIGSDTLTLDSDITEWKGKRPLEIISLGVDEQGNIRLALIGECPRCGLPFDDGFDKEKYFDDLNDQASIVISSPNTGKSAKVNLSTGGKALDTISSVSTKGKTQKKIKGAGKETPELNPELLDVLKDVSAEYPGRAINVYKSVGAESGPHARGEALDIGVAGVSNRELGRKLYEKGYGTKKGELGLYEKSPFVHVGVREKPALWVDTAGKGESAKYLKNEEKKRWIDENLYKSDMNDSNMFMAPVTEGGV